MMINSLKVCLYMIGNQGWLGGVSYIESLVQAMQCLDKEDRPQIYLAISEEILHAVDFHRKIFPLLDGLIYVGNNDEMARDILQIPFTHCCTYDELNELLDFYFPVNSDVIPGLCSASWIPDFQHLYLPDYFSPFERCKRDQAFQRIAEQSRLVVFSSENAKKDFHHFFPDSKAITRVLSFHTNIDNQVYEKNSLEIQKKYNLPNEFLICSNQFWPHKNHDFLFKAWSLLNKKGKNIHLVCTGPTDDPQSPETYPKLQALINDLNLNDNIHILGIIPREDQLQLLRRSLAVIQPSLFEGWSSVVEESRALGKTIFLSDLPVHYEQNPKYAVFFDRYDVNDLVQKILDTLPNLSPGPDFSRERTSWENVQSLIEDYAHQFCSIVIEAQYIFNRKIKTINKSLWNLLTEIQPDGKLDKNNELHETTCQSIENINQEDCLEVAYKNIRDPKTKILPRSVPQHVIQGLSQYGINVINYVIDVDDYHQYFKKARYTEDFPEYYSFNIKEKSLEHYITAKMLDLKSDDIYIDVASQHSPIPKIYSRLFGVTSYKQDLDYPPGLNGDTIGGDAANMPVPDRFADKMALHCSFEHFEGDADCRFIHEIERVLKPGGKVCIVPLYLSSQYHIITDPLIAISQNVDFEKDTLVFCKRGWNNRFGRIYDPVSLFSRIKQNLGSLKMKIFNIKNAKEVDSSCYVEYAMLLEKDGEIVSTLLVEDYIKLADDKVAVGDIDGAIDTLFECSGLYPDIAEVYQLLAVLMTKKQTHQSAKAMLDKAIALKPDDADLYNQLGTVHYLAGDMDASRAAYEKALTIDPNLEHVKANLEELSRTSAVHEVSSAVENELTSLLDQINRHIAFSRALTDNLVSMAERVEKMLGHPVKLAVTPPQEAQSDHPVVFGKGFYQDEGGFRWVASEGQLMLSSVSQFKAMEMDFDLSCANANCYQKFPFETGVFVNDEEKAHLVFDVDEQTRSVKLNIPTNIQDVVVKIVSSQSFIPARLGGGSPDTRELSVQFRNLNLSTVPREVQVNEPDDAKTKAEREAQARNQEEVNWWKHFIFKHFSPDRETSEKLFLERFRIECTKRWDYICEPLSIDTYQYREAALLDIGNGPCGILNFIPGNIKVGIDPNNKMYRENEILYNVEEGVRYITCPAEKLPLPGEYFDFISCVNVLDHVSDPQIVLDEIIRVLKPGGVFFLSVDTRKEEETSLVHPHAFDGDKFIEMAVPLVCLYARNDQPCYDDNPVNKRFDGWFRKP